MAPILTARNRLHAPYFIFIRDCTISDRELLKTFGLSTYHRCTSANNFGRYTVLAKHQRWTSIADDWHYTLWNMQSTRTVIQALAQTFDIYTCSVGDSDQSFDFVIYQNGQISRKYAYETLYPAYLSGEVTDMIGSPLPCETELLKLENAMDIVFGIGEYLGIPMEWTESQLRLYAHPVE